MSTTPVIKYDDLTDDDLTAIKANASAEEQRRLRVKRAPEQSDAIARQYLADVGRHEGTEWVQPEGGFDAYPWDYVVTLGGTEWKSTVAANMDKPALLSKKWVKVSE